MKVLVFEYLSAGELRGPSEEKIAAEGEYMLSRLLHAFRNELGTSTITILNERLLKKYGSGADKLFPAEEIFVISKEARRSEAGDGWKELHGNRYEVFETLLRKVDFVFLVAPESDGILAEFTDLVERMGTGNLGAGPEAVKTAGDKWLSYAALVREGFPVPQTRLFSPDDPFAGDMFDFPVVIKPRLGAGAELIFLRNLRELKDALHGIRDIFRSRELVLQQFREGTPASVSAVGNGRETLPLSLNLQSLNIQSIDRSEGFGYKGGRVGIRHPLRERIFETVREIPLLFPGLKGYFGVDVLLRDEDFDIVEINPRLTSSYLGLSLGSEVNPLKYILDAARGTVLPAYPPRVRETDFSVSPDAVQAYTEIGGF